MRGRTGFTLVELTVALVAGAVVSAAALMLLVQQRKIWFEQMWRTDGHATLRAAQVIVGGDLRGIVGDSVTGGVVLGSPSRVVYRAGRGMGFLCLPLAPGDSVATLGVAFRGIRPLNPTVDSVLLHEGGEWVPRGVTSVGGAGCPDNGPGITVGLSAPPGVWIPIGAPVRWFETAEVRAYRSGSSWWVGVRRARVGGGWPVIQPLLGPIASAGLSVAGFDQAGRATNAGPAVARFDLTVRVPPASGRAGPVSSGVQFTVRRRNEP